METTYGIDVRNRFDLCFDDDVEDPLEILKQQEAELLKRKLEKAKDRPKHAKLLQTTNVGSKVKKEVISTTSIKANVDTEKPQFRPAKAGGRQTERVGANDDKNRKNFETGFSEGQWDTEPRRGRGGSRGARGVARGRPGGYDQRGKREFDRQSGSTKSGVKPVEKREGGGAHNWGTVADEMQFNENPDNEERSSDEGPTPNVENKEEGGPEKAKEPEEGVMTLDEWKKKEQSKRCIPSYNLRKPGEGETEKKWGKLYLLKKKEFEEDDDEEEEDEEDEIQKRGRQKQTLDIEIRFDDMSVRGGRGRGRGYSRGGRGKGNVGGAAVSGGGEVISARSSSNATQLPAPKVDDFIDFPSLSNT